MDIGHPSQKHAPYVYDPLTSDRCIRLIRLRPSQSFDALLELDLYEDSLENATQHQYEALSYTWGAPGSNESVTCCGRELVVRVNCAAALRQLRYLHKTRILWVDAICINQGQTVDAIRERSIQIMMMGDIYSNATHTLCWLGQGTTYTNEVMRHLENIGRCPSQRGHNKLKRFEASIQAEGHIDAESSCLDHIFCHDWHRRVWTVQEVAFSRSCYVLCGSSSIAWERYAAAAEFLIFDQFIDNLDNRASEALTGIAMRNVLRNYTLPSAGGPSAAGEDTEDRRIPDLMSCLTDAVYLHSTDPKDKIYGLFALYANFGVRFPSVDYRRSIAEVYSGAARSLIAWSGSLALLINACSFNRDSTFPSWVPDWRDSSTRLFMHPSAASRNSRWTSFADDAGHILKVRGRVIGKVRSVAMDFPTHMHPDDSGILSGGASVFGVESVDILRLLIQKIKFFRDLLAAISEDGWSEPTVSDDLLEILTLGHYLDGEADTQAFDVLYDLLRYPDTVKAYDLSVGSELADRWRRDDEQNNKSWTANLLNCATIAAGLLSGSVMLFGERLDGLPAILDVIKDFSANLADQAILRFDLVDKDPILDTIFGSAFSAVVEGDSVALLEGAEWPVILRQASPSGQTWRFVSPAYVPHHMDGEAWPGEGDEPSEALQLFDLV